MQTPSPQPIRRSHGENGALDEAWQERRVNPWADQGDRVDQCYMPSSYGGRQFSAPANFAENGRQPSQLRARSIGCQAVFQIYCDVIDPGVPVVHVPGLLGI